ncbi:hypothetical protein TD95_000715 [Thielaviopsis punctulata]|uniref:Glutamyl-tRNA(Gln) amidotransferase subunit B, mitochondrial n=1 Tax=Thielaviopsis punctulata TaxID=72032 RepID=A0A0F4ZKV6_9PEZI|nr:hypothetical protein TD95_000715 [Thielaviopsis punctulata]
MSIVQALRAPLRQCTASRLRPRMSRLPLATANHRNLQTQAPPAASPPTPDPSTIPLRKRLKDEAKRQKAAGTAKKSKRSSQTVPGWELTVGIEIHAQLNSPAKLFSPASVIAPPPRDAANQHAALFDLAVPGSQPLFQPAVLVPAVRAALALNCSVNTVSRFDRKHYFWWDQPAGYQLTQYYSPFAQSGSLTLLARDGIAAEDGESVTVRIKQVQLEQDTAKTLSQPGAVHWIDFNRAGTPLIEIITEPDFHHPRTAAVFVDKVQTLLSTFDACVVGMEAGGLRADVNVSVRRMDDPSRPLGTRTEIKNLNTVKAIEDAIIAERDRQIRELEAGSTIASETRGWTLGTKETRRLRGKEGEVDYRYMPDPDVPPLVIGKDLVACLRESVKATPDIEVEMLVSKFGLKSKDAMALVTANSEDKLDYFYRLVQKFHQLQAGLDAKYGDAGYVDTKLSVLAGNWVLHEFGRLTKVGKDAEAEDPECETPEHLEDLVSVDHLAELLYHLHNGKITSRVAKEVFFVLYYKNMVIEGADGELVEEKSLTKYLDWHNLWFSEISTTEYRELAESVFETNKPRSLELIKTEEPPKGKVMWLLGDMLRTGPAENMVPETAEAILRDVIAEARKKSL